MVQSAGEMTLLRALTALVQNTVYIWCRKETVSAGFHASLDVVWNNNFVHHLQKILAMDVGDINRDMPQV